MLEVEFQEWLKSRGAKTQAGLNSRIYAVKTIEKISQHLVLLMQIWMQPTRRMDLRNCGSGSKRFAVMPKTTAMTIDY